MREREFGRIAEKAPEIEDRIPDTFTCLRCGGVFPNDQSYNGRGVSHCAACHLTFKSMAGFDEHRTYAPAPDYRRCRTADEMRERGYEPNDKGYWRKPRPADTIPGAS